MEEIIRIALGAFGLLGILIPSYISYKLAVRVSHNNQKTESKKVDAAAYERAKSLYESGIQSLEEQLQHMRDQLAEERNLHCKLRQQINSLERILAKMRRQLLLAGIELDTDTSTEVNSE